jgi:transcriptional regulator with GAF, ATPase, and Fis domain
MAESCSDRERCLHLRSSAGIHTGIDGQYRRVPVGAFKIGQIASSREHTCTSDVAGDARVPNKVWVREHGLRSFAGYPLVFRDELLGVIGTFSRKALTDAEFRRLEAFAVRASIAIKNAARFREVEALGRRLEQDNRYLREEVRLEHDYSNIVGRSPALKKVLEQVERVGPTDGTALILGETGTGKELIAHAIHALGPRRDRPLIKVDCGALSPSRVESELFGDERDASPGADRRLPGRLDLADGGTLFLDEVGELTPETQSKLLRFLQQGRFEPAGSDRPHSVDVRVIAATSRSLAAEVDAGRFRSDLYYRLSVFPIELPALRRRKSDIPLLVEHFVDVYGARLGKRFEGVSDATLRRLTAYPWPGNVRELRNVLERAAILSTGPRLDVPPESLGAADATGGGPAGAGGDVATLRQAERAHILLALERCGGVVEGARGAAALLDLPPSTLRSRMSKLGIRVRRRVGSDRAP